MSTLSGSRSWLGLRVLLVFPRELGMGMGMGMQGWRICLAICLANGKQVVFFSFVSPPVFCFSPGWCVFLCVFELFGAIHGMCCMVWPQSTTLRTLMGVLVMRFLTHCPPPPLGSKGGGGEP